MTAIVFLSLPLCLLAVAALMMVALVDGAFRCSLVPVGASPLGRSKSDRAFPVVELSATGEQLFGESRAEAILKCPATPFVPRVTDPEARAIASEIHRRGSLEVGRILERSRSCSGHCPMRLSSGQCDCSTVRPLNCIGRCQSDSESPEWASGLGDSLAVAFRDHLQAHRVNSETRPLDLALVSLLETPQSNSVASRN